MNCAVVHPSTGGQLILLVLLTTLPWLVVLFLILHPERWIHKVHDTPNLSHERLTKQVRSTTHHAGDSSHV